MRLAYAGASRAGGAAPEITLDVVGPYLVLCVAYLTVGLVRVPRRLGDPSYGQYLYAFPVQQTISYLVAPRTGWILFSLALPVTTVLAIASWHLVERPALDLKRRLTHSHDALPDVPTSRVPWEAVQP
jgi:peptidoglycan/LPS O-acetylase OafA/YrhL